MANTKELRRRIKSIKNTSQITKAMQMVSATKMRRSQLQALAGRPYNNTLSSILSLISLKDDFVDIGTTLNLHPLIGAQASPNIAILLISTDKGLCGSLNTNLFRVILNNPLFNINTGKISFYTIGKKGRDFIVRTKRNLVGDFENSERIEINKAQILRKFFMNLFLNNELGEVYLLYPDFVSTLRQEAKLVKILPIDPSSLTQKISSILKNIPHDGKDLTEGLPKEFIFEPSAKEVLDFGLVNFLEIQIYQSLLEAKASEHSARMMAMKNATDNALDLVEDLKITYNGVRQDNITKELLEITSAGAALE